MTYRQGARTAEQRWREADSLVGGEGDTGARRRVRRSRRLRIGLALVLGLLPLAVLAVLLGTSWRLPDLARSTPSELSRTVGYVLVGLAVVLDLLGLIGLVRARQWGAAWRSPFSALTWKERRIVLQQVRGRRALVPGQLRVVTEMARRLSAQGPLTLITLGVLLDVAGQSLSGDRLALRVLDACLVPLGVVALVLIRRDTRLARRFLSARRELRDDPASPLPERP